MMDDKKMTHKDYNLRYQATFIIEAKTPLMVGSGDKDILLDNPIIRDAFDLPYIPATSLVGVMRHSLGYSDTTIESYFGFQKDNGKEGAGSRLILSSAHILAANNKVADGLEMASALQKELQELLVFPQRDHAKINHRGVADKEVHGKFESQLLAKGTRFVFEMEFWGNEADNSDWNNILNIIAHPLFRIGGGTRKGFGELSVVNCWQRILNLSDENHLKLYLNKTTQIQLPLDASFKVFECDKNQYLSGFEHYQLQIEPRDFFLFDGQFEPDLPNNKIALIEAKKEKLADMTPKTENMIIWDTTGLNPRKSEYQWLIPATSVKGAIAHRVAFHYNKATEIIAEMESYLQNTPPPTTKEEAEMQKDKINKYLAILNGNNDAVLALFGREAEEVEIKDQKGKTEKKQLGRRGKVIISDVYVPKAKTEKILNHVKIDRFTGGAIDTALFSEKVAHTKEKFVLDIFVEKVAFEKDENIKKAFENTLCDLVSEQLPLGGGVMRGHGMMRGKILKNKEELTCKK